MALLAFAIYCVRVNGRGQGPAKVCAGLHECVAHTDDFVPTYFLMAHLGVSIVTDGTILPFILRRMSQNKTERSNCHFAFRASSDGKPQIIVELYHQTISALDGAVAGFDLLGGTTTEQAKKLVALLNENVLDIFVTLKQHEATQT